MTRRVGVWTAMVSFLCPLAATLGWLGLDPAGGPRVLHAAALAGGQEADSDGDTMPDACESFFGLNPTDPADATADPDGDGLTNAQGAVRPVFPRPSEPGSSAGDLPLARRHGHAPLIARGGRHRSLTR